MTTRTLFFTLMCFLQINLACTSDSSPSSNDSQPNQAPVLPETSPANSVEEKKENFVGRHALPTKDGRVMVFDFQPGTEKSVWLLIHGLADDMNMLNALAEQIQADGHSVLKVDLQGHGETLKEYLRTHQELPEKLHYFDNVTDIEIILSTLQIKELTIVGHSYGGGIAYALAAELNRTGSAQVKSVHMLAPYVQRIDKFLRESYPSLIPRLWPNRAATDENLDSVMDPILDQFMQTTYRAYIMENMYGSTSAQLNQEQKKEVDMKVQTAILATKGIRPFDLLDDSSPLPKIGAPLQVIGGKKDTLVIPKQLLAFEKRLKSENLSYKLKFIEGANSTHLFPRLLPAETYQLILDDQN